MGIEEAAITLDKSLRGNSWYVAVGIYNNKGEGINELHVYTSKRTKLPIEVWNGFTVVNKFTGQIKAQPAR